MQGVVKCLHIRLNCQVLKIVLAELMKGYQHSIKYNKLEWELAFEKVLRSYLSEYEMSQAKAAINAGDDPLAGE